MKRDVKGKKKKYVLQSGIVLKTNFIKNGLDTSRLVNIIVRFRSPNDFKMVEYPFPKNLFFVSDVSFGECVGILINKFKMTKEEAIAKVKLWHEALSLQRITEEGMDGFYPIVEEANKMVVKRLGQKYEIGENDKKIIACFLKEGVNIVHTFDEGFKKTCKELNMNIASINIKDLKAEKRKS